ncbi:hypothetical protein TWF281_002834 [Arthrobotrys megalospora]
MELGMDAFELNWTWDSPGELPFEAFCGPAGSVGLSPQSDMTLRAADELLESLRVFGSDFAASLLRSCNRSRSPTKTRVAETRTRTPPTTAGIRIPYFEVTIPGTDEVVGVVSDIEAVVGLVRRAVGSEAMVDNV